MHTHAPHRARIIATSGDEAHEHRPASPRDLSRLVGHFRNIRASTKDRGATKSHDADGPFVIGLSPEYDAVQAESQQDGEESSGGSKDEGEAEDQSAAAGGDWSSSLDGLPATAAAASLIPGAAKVAGESAHRVRVANTRGAARRQVTANPQLDMQRDVETVIESIVSRIDEFCSAPAVLEFGDWKVNVSLDADVLPNCNLTVSLSRFDLMLRFETPESRSANLIYSNQVALRQSLGEMMQAWPSGPRNIEISVI
ncbi:hypothetical protein GWC77_23455 [Paraburkholderia sp. NMBU_R16]|uniref:type III secretion system protein SctP n=1 Tax=Paraburkholderia sp. NMBU_R16 TaxID=2698676 RepID=UPI001563DB72|nr:type III secretion system protein SctP [Paraburkholderia sp. NMBU_R16]NRO98870.1 hypothetical protein [Paraburkholderia sp. NMBU_R16]